MKGRRGLGLTALAATITLAGGGVALAAFSGTTTSTATISADSDLRAPITARSAIGKTEGGITGFVRPSGTYFTYGEVNDNPATASPSGVNTVTSSLGSASLAAGTFTTTDLTTYNRRSASTTAAAGLTNGSTLSYTLTSTDNAGNSGTSSAFSATVDSVLPTATDVQAANRAGGIADRTELGDTLTLTFSEPIDPHAIVAGARPGVASDIVVRAAHGAHDDLTFYNSTNTTQLPLGLVDLDDDYSNANHTYGATGTKSKLVATGNTIVITLGTPSVTTQTGGSANATMIWTTPTGATRPYDRAGNLLNGPATVTESGTADNDF